jgi:hypothetical protein
VLEAGDRRLTAAELAKCRALYQRRAGWFLGDDPGPAQPPEALGRLIATLPCTGQDTVTRFAEFLAAGQATAINMPAASAEGRRLRQQRPSTNDAA